jgi:hypothetical protein
MLEMPSAAVRRGRAAARRQRRQSGVNAYLIRTGEQTEEPGWPSPRWACSTAPALRSLDAHARCGPLPRYAAEDLMSLLAAQLDLTAVAAETFVPRPDTLIPSGRLEPSSQDGGPRRHQAAHADRARLARPHKVSGESADGSSAVLVPPGCRPRRTSSRPRSPSRVAGEFTAAPVHVAGEFTAAPVLYNKVTPLYPEGARLARVQGRRRHRSHRRRRGQCPGRTRSPLHPALDRAALEAVCCWKYRLPFRTAARQGVLHDRRYLPAE